MRDIAASIAAWILERHGIAPAPPVNVEELARRMGVQEITELDVPEDGRLEAGRVTRIVIQRGVVTARRRFTLAHELAHLALLSDREEVIRLRSRGNVTNEERFCDAIATALLIPSSWLARRYRHRVRNISTVRHVAHETQASMETATIQLREVLGWQNALLRWRRTDTGWRLFGVAALPSWIGSSVRSGVTIDDILEGLTSRGRDTRTMLPLKIRGRPIDVDAQVSVRGRSSVALVNTVDLEEPWS